MSGTATDDQTPCVPQQEWQEATPIRVNSLPVRWASQDQETKAQVRRFFEEQTGAELAQVDLNKVYIMVSKDTGSRHSFAYILG